MKERLLPGFKRLRGVSNQWGGSTAIFFAYTHLAHDLCNGLHMALLPVIRAGLGLNYMQSGLLLSAHHITSGISQIPGGWLSDRFNRYVVIAIGVGGVGLAALAVGLSSAYYPLLIILVIMGILSGVYHPSAVSLLSSSFERARRGKVIGLHLVGGSIGFTIGPVLGGLIAAMLGWRSAFIILCIPALVAVTLVLWKLRQQKRAAGGELLNHPYTGDGALAEPTTGRVGLVQVLRSVAAITALVVFTQLIAGSAMAFVPLYLVDKHGVAPTYATMLLGIIRGGGVVGSMLGGWLSDKWDRKNAIFLTLVATGPMVYLITIMPLNLSLVAVFILVGIVMQMKQSTTQPFLMDSTPQQLRGIIFGIYFGLSMEGASILQPVVGHFMDTFGIVEVFHIIALISVASSLLALLILIKSKLSW